MRRNLIVLLAVVSLLTACGPHVTQVQTGPPVTTATPGFTYVAVGASESVGVGATSPLSEAWTKVVWQALPRNTQFIDVAVPGYTTNQANNSEVARAQDAKPQIVTVWLNVNDIVAGVTPVQYRTQLLVLLRGLQKTGAKVFVANTPPVESLPAFIDATNGDFGSGNPFVAAANVPSADAMKAIVNQYNVAIADDAQQTRATVVDLNAAYANATDSADLVATDGFHPSTAGHIAVAQAFIAAMKSAGVL